MVNDQEHVFEIKYSILQIKLQNSYSILSPTLFYMHKTSQITISFLFLVILIFFSHFKVSKEIKQSVIRKEV